jgi:hypothetical protein
VEFREKGRVRFGVTVRLYSIVTRPVSDATTVLCGIRQYQVLLTNEPIIGPVPVNPTGNLDLNFFPSLPVSE